MATLVIDDVDEDLMARLKTQAAARAQPVPAVAREILSRGLPPRELAAEAFRKIRAMTPPGPQEDSVEIIRRMRDE